MATVASAAQISHDYYYVNSSNGNHIKVFQEDALMSDFGGKILPKKGSKTHKGAIGKIKKGGVFQDINWSDLDPPEEDGSPLNGWLVGIEIENAGE